MRGTTLRTRLGLWDTWAYFSTARMSRPAAAARSSWLSTVVGPRELEAVIRPAPRGRLTVQRRTATGWRRAGSLSNRTDGRYRFGVRNAGTYRVSIDGAAGPAVRVK